MSSYTLVLQSVVIDLTDVTAQQERPLSPAGSVTTKVCNCLSNTCVLQNPPHGGEVPDFTALGIFENERNSNRQAGSHDSHAVFDANVSLFNFYSVYISQKRNSPGISPRTDRTAPVPGA